MLKKNPRPDLEDIMENTPIKDILWTEKYRPTMFSEVVGLPNSLKNLKLDSLPHLLFVGKPGLGKTTCARIIAHELQAEFVELNASDDRGIQVVRDKIKFFAQKASFGRKVILLDEADGITNDAQQSLRRIMEECSKYTLFILTANYQKKIIEPIRSRCDEVEFVTPKKEDVKERLKHICSCEKIEYDEKDLDFIIKVTSPDIRKSINILQNASVTGKLIVDNVKIEDDVLSAIWMIFQRRNYKLLRELLGDYSPDYQQVYEFLYNKIFDEDIDQERKKKALLVVIDRAYKDQNVANPEMNFVACCIELEKYV